MNTPINVGIASKLGNYSDAIQINPGVRWLYTSGTPGLNEDGTVPQDFETQARLAWKGILATLHVADMDIEHIVKINQSLLRCENLTTYRKIRNEFSRSCSPSFHAQFYQRISHARDAD